MRYKPFKIALEFGKEGRGKEKQRERRGRGGA